MRRALRHPRQRGRQRFAPGRVVAAVQPKFGLWCRLHQRTLSQALHARGPDRLRDGSLANLGIKAKVAQGCYGRTCVMDLMRAGKVGQRQVQKTGLVLIDHPPAIFGDVPVLAMHQQWYPKLRGPRFD